MLGKWIAGLVLMWVFGGDVAAGAEHSEGPVVHFINYYAIILDSLGLNAESAEHWIPSLGALLSLILITILGLKFKKSVDHTGNDLRPPESFGARWIVEKLMGIVDGIGRDTIGHHYERYLPILAAIFVFIFVNNLMGLVPGFPPSTESMNTNLVIGLTAFLVYNLAGMKEHGFGYIKQFLGPVAWLAPLMFGIELVSHLGRPFSLSMRLMGNLFADHLMLGVFTGLTYVIFPSLLMFFGLLVAVVQSFVFTLLTSIYISMAVSHDH